jgi:cytochrome P450
MAQLDIASSTFKANPYTDFARLRASDPVYLLTSSGEQRTWLVTRYLDAEVVLRDERFVKDRQHIHSLEQLAHHHTAPASASDLMNMSLVDLDPPDHTRLRSLFYPFFAPRKMQTWSPHIQKVTDELIDAVEPQGHMDLIEDFAAVLPIRIITRMLGIPAEDCTQLHAWTKTTADALGDPSAFQRVNEILHEFYAYLQALIEQKRREPDDGLISTLVQTESDVISERELAPMIFLLITAGHDTADNLIGNGMLALLTHPEQKRRLLLQPELITAAVDEFLRYRSPFMLSTMRWAREEVELGGKQIRRGDAVLVSLASVNRDEGEFMEAEELDIGRKENHHLAFGKGMHYCLGAHLARQEGRIAIGTLLRRLPNLRLQVEPDALSWRTGSTVLGVEHLPVTF